MDMARRSLLAGGLSLPLVAAAGRANPVAQSVTSRIVVTKNRVWTTLAAGNNKPVPFIIDTGAVFSIMSNELAKNWGLKAKGTTTVRGIGGAEKQMVYSLDNVLIGERFAMSRLDIAGSRALDRAEFPGLLSAGFISTLNSEIDFASGEWRVFPDSPNIRKGYVKIPDGFVPTRDTQMLAIAGHMDKFKGEFLFDTGSPGTILLDGNASRAMKLYKSDQPYAPHVARGFGSVSVPVRIYRMPTVKLHDFEFQNMLVRAMHPDATKGQFPRFHGLVGLAVLRTFHILTDAANKELYIARNGLPVSDDDYPKSGLWLDRKDNEIVVAEVGTGSPAAEIGLQIGDRIVGENWQGILDKITAKTGSTVSFDYERSGVRKKAEFNLKPFL